MALLRKMRKRPEVEVTIYDGSHLLDVKGESHYQDALALIAGPKCEEGYDLSVHAALVREPSNPHDRNAIAVHAVEPTTNSAVKVGYVNRFDAANLAPALDRLGRDGVQVGLHGFIRGGWLRPGGDEGHFGITLRYDPADFGLAGRR